MDERTHFQCFQKMKNAKTVFWWPGKFGEKNLDFEEINQKFRRGGLIGYGNSLLDFFIARWKVFPSILDAYYCMIIDY